MIHIKKSEERGHLDHGWLNTYHTFSFGDYYDPKAMGFRSLRVINDDVVAPGQGFGAHPHRDMEIITYVLDGALEHKDSLGNHGVIRPGEVQRMSAGRGVVHSEFNHSEAEAVRLLQIWLLPEQNGIKPGYEQREFPPAERRGAIKRVAARKPEDGEVLIHQDASVYASVLGTEENASLELPEARYGFVQVATGEIELNGKRMKQGDSAAISDERKLEFRGVAPESEFLLFDLA
jgi:redox-sensitive bicupin YhaK (pirin superfamily)